jgi:hypothetical protein
LFRRAAGFTAQYYYLTLVVAPDFDEWRIWLQGLGVTINGGRQFTEAKAKEQARLIADTYIHAEKHEDLPALDEVDWVPIDPETWLNFHP